MKMKTASGTNVDVGSRPLITRTDWVVHTIARIDLEQALRLLNDTGWQIFSVHPTTTVQSGMNPMMNDYRMWDVVAHKEVPVDANKG